MFLLLTHAAAAAVALALAVDWGWRLGLLALVGLSLGYLLWARVWLAAPWSLRAARWDALGWVVLLGDGRELEARLLPGTWVGVRLVILLFSLSGWRRAAMVLTVDGIDGDRLRQLRARLRLAGREGPV